MPRLSDLVTLWPPSERPTAVAVALAESGGDANAWCYNCAGVAEDSRGLWQINYAVHTQFDGQRLFEPAYNANAAYEVWQVQGWQAWSTYTSGRYRQFLGQDREVSIGALPDASPVPDAPSMRQQVVQVGLLAAAVVAALYLLSS